MRSTARTLDQKLLPHNREGIQEDLLKDVGLAVGPKS